MAVISFSVYYSQVGYPRIGRTKMTRIPSSYKVEPYETVLEVRTTKRGRYKKTPLSPQMQALLTQQNMARTAAHASNLRAMNKACENLETWARQARYS